MTVEEMFGDDARPLACVPGLDAFKATIERAWSAFFPEVQRVLGDEVAALGFGRGSGGRGWQPFWVPVAIPVRTGDSDPSKKITRAARDLVGVIRQHIGEHGEILGCRADLVWGNGRPWKPEPFAEGQDLGVDVPGPCVVLIVYARAAEAEPAAPSGA
jgi:hypothetical protein